MVEFGEITNLGNFERHGKSTGTFVTIIRSIDLKTMNTSMVSSHNSIAFNRSDTENGSIV